jgi:hypothetical protein
MLINLPNPAFAFWANPYQWGPFRVYLDRFARMTRGQLVPPPTKEQLIIDPTVEHVRALAALGWLTVDIETRPAHKARPWTGKDPTQARLKCVGMGCPEWGFAHLWVGNGPVKKEIKRILADPNILKVFQNGIFFDIPILKRYGMEVVNFEDTRDMRRATSTTAKVGLGPMGAIFCDLPNWKQQEEEELEDEFGDMK